MPPPLHPKKRSPAYRWGLVTDLEKGTKKRQGISTGSDELEIKLHRLRGLRFLCLKDGNSYSKTIISLTANMKIRIMRDVIRLVDT